MLTSNASQAGKRVLGGVRRLLRERTASLIVVLCAVAIVALLWHQSRQRTRLIESTTIHHAAQYSKALAEFRKLYTSEVVVKAARRGVTVTHDYADKDNAIPLPATLSMLLGKRLAEGGGGHTRLYSPYPFPWRNASGGLRDEFAADAWAALNQKPDEPYYRFEQLEGEPVLRYATADVMSAGCVSCHNSHPDTPKTGWKQGDVRGVLEVAVPLSTAVAQSRADLKESVFVVLGLSTFGIVCGSLVVARLRRTTNELEQRVDERTSELADANAHLTEAIRASTDSETRTRAVLESASDCIISVDHEGCICEFNPSAEATFGYRRDDVIGQPVATTIIPPGLRQQHGEAFRRFVETGVSRLAGQRIEISALRSDGREFPIELTISAPCFLDGKPLMTACIRDITRRRQSEKEQEALHQQLMGASRQAGMAEVSAGVLHNVGNVLNSVNVSVSLLRERLGANRAEDLVRACALIDEHRDNAADFFAHDPRGPKLLDFLDRLGLAMVQDNNEAIRELVGLEENVEHIKQVIDMQQSFAATCSIQEPVDLAKLVDDAVKINDSSLLRHEVIVHREYDDVPQVVTEKHKVMQILVNLIKNAKQAVSDSQRQKRWIRLRIRQQDSETVVVQVSDNGAGILPENLPKLFTHGFTTKKHGHGFGLHSGALAAREFGGTLAAHSDGEGLGATFTLTLPLGKSTSAGVPIVDDDNPGDPSNETSDANQLQLQ